MPPWQPAGRGVGLGVGLGVALGDELVAELVVGLVAGPFTGAALELPLPHALDPRVMTASTAPIRSEFPIPELFMRQSVAVS